MSVARAVHRINRRFGLRLVVWGAVLALAAVGLSFVPLLDVLGYDFAFALGLLAAFAAVDVGQGTVAAARRAARPVGLGRLAAEATAAGLALLALPLLVSLANGLRVRNCNLAAGLAFFALLPAGSVLFAAPAGVLAGVLVRGRRLGRLVALALPVLSVAWALLRLYVDPPVFAFDPFGGYFPGPIYDEAMRPPGRLFWFRLANLTWISAALALGACLTGGGRARPAGPPEAFWRSGWRSPSPGLVLLTAGLVAAAAGWFAARAKLGFHFDRSDLVAALGLTTRTQHFVVHSDAGTETPAELELVHRDLEFRYHQLTRILGAEPRTPIAVYRFSSAAQKKELTGAAGTLFARPWTREIFVQAERFPASRLRHELAHVFASAFGDRLFGVALAWRWWGPVPVPRLSSGIIEGVAEAADFGDPGGRATLHEEARAMIALGRAPPLEGILGLGFSAQSGARAYTLAGSFCRYLLDAFGAARLRALHASAGDFPGVYGRSLVELERDWRTFLERLPSDPALTARAEERFRRPAIFHRVCARELAARVAEARGLLRTVPAEAAGIYESVCRDDPGEPVFRLEWAEAVAAAGQSGPALDALARAEREGLTRPLRVRAANLAAVIHFHAGRMAEAEAAVRRALEAASDDGDERTALARLRALSDARARTTLGRVLFGEQVGRPLEPGLVVHLVGEFARAFADEALGPYLVGRQLATRDPALAVTALAAACPLDGGGPKVALAPVVAKECRRLLGESAFLAGELGVARAAYQNLRQRATLEADRLRASDFLERIEWEASRPPGPLQLAGGPPASARRPAPAPLQPAGEPRPDLARDVAD